MPKILIADDHMIVRKGIVFLCHMHLALKEIDEVEKGSELMEALKSKSYSHLILDLVLGDGPTVSLIPAVRSLYPELPILVFSAQPLDMYIGPLSRYGISYFIAKDQSEKETLQTLRQFIDNPRPPVISPHAADYPFGFSLREIEVLGYLLKGLKNSQIAERLNVSRQTVSTFIARIQEKSGTKNLIELKDWASLFFKLEHIS
jgi:two-component system, NarL family, invasion response regulator UvrY